MRDIESKYSEGEITSKTEANFTSITNSDVKSKTELNVTSKIEKAEEREAFLAMARRNASLMFSKYL